MSFAFFQEMISPVALLQVRASFLRQKVANSACIICCLKNLIHRNINFMEIISFLASCRKSLEATDVFYMTWNKSSAFSSGSGKEFRIYYALFCHGKSSLLRLSSIVFMEMECSWPESWTWDLQMGQFECVWNQVSMQATWNTWAQFGRCFSHSPSSNSPKQTTHS